MKYPPLPRRVMCAAGSVRVEITSEPLKVGESDCSGYWNACQRVITIDGTEPLSHQWLALYHELEHVALADSGVENLFDGRTVEAICDATATARMRERFG